MYSLFIFIYLFFVSEGRLWFCFNPNAWLNLDWITQSLFLARGVETEIIFNIYSHLNVISNAHFVCISSVFAHHIPLCLKKIRQKECLTTGDAIAGGFLFGRRWRLGVIQPATSDPFGGAIKTEVLSWQPVAVSCLRPKTTKLIKFELGKRAGLAAPLANSLHVGIN